MHDFRSLRVLQDAMDLVEEVYQVSKHFPDTEKFGLTSQIRRSSVSVPSNIAEGASRNSPAEFRHFLGIASGSGGELLTQLMLAQRLGFVEEASISPCIEKIEVINRMTSKLIHSLSKQSLVLST